MNQSSLPRTVDLKSAVFILIGYIVGATIFILPGSLAAEAGPAVFLAYLFAGIPAIFASFVMAQVGGAFPTNGASYALISKVLSPFWGFIYLCIVISMAALIIPLIATGFADYLQHFLPQINTTLVSLLVIIFFVGSNCLGMVMASRIQIILVLLFLLGLTIFGVTGVLEGDVKLLQPMFPKGISPLIIAAITAYFSYAGVFVIAEIAGEVKEPGKTIPRAILISFIVVISVYILVPLALVMTLPFDSYSGSSLAVVNASNKILPTWITNFIAVGALFAAATSINGIIMGLSRDFLKGAEVNLFSQYFSKISKETFAPIRAVVFIGVLSIIGVLIGGSITEYAQVAVMGLMLTQIVIGIAVFKMPKSLPEVYQHAHYKLSTKPLYFFSLGFIFFSIAFFFYLGFHSPKTIVIGALYLIICTIYFSYRKNKVDFVTT